MIETTQADSYPPRAKKTSPRTEVTAKDVRLSQPQLLASHGSATAPESFSRPADPHPPAPSHHASCDPGPGQHVGPRDFACPPEPGQPHICPPTELVDVGLLNATLARTLAETADPKEKIERALNLLAEAKKKAEARLRAALAQQPFEAHGFIRAQAWLQDVLVTAALSLASGPLALEQPVGEQSRKGVQGGRSPLSTRLQNAAHGLAVVAVGGYGRAEMAPYSDVDLLFLVAKAEDPFIHAVIERALYLLWDLKLKVGHSTRTVKECLHYARSDMTIRTALLERRFLWGDQALAERLATRLEKELFGRNASAFIEAKLAERAERHARQGGQRYVLEPNVKEGKGGLRDLHTLYWIAKYLHRVNDAAGLVPLGFFTEAEYATFRAAESFLWAVRCHLHQLTNRATDQLTFDLQPLVAERMRYVDHSGRRAVEHFMQDFFRHATRVGEITRIFLTALEARHVKKAPKLPKLFRHRLTLMPGLRIDQNRLNVADHKTFLADPLNLLRIFEEALRTGLLLHPDAMRLIAANLRLIDDRIRENPEAARIFLDLLLKHGNPERALRRMNELGVLSAFIPEFEPIVAMMQFNVYHHYTVDEHTIQCISQLAKIEKGELIEELPIATEILANGVNRRVLYLALLLHDIGKGRAEDHSVLGAQVARKVAPRLGLSPDECETVEWLVRHHLLMSDTAQKRDIGDPRTVRDFAKRVGSIERLNLLTVLTVCDIRGVGPNAWNNWKAMLLRRLYRETLQVLEGGLEALSRVRREDEAKAALCVALADWPEAEVKAELERHYGPYWQGLSTDTHVVFARLLRGLREAEIRIDLHPEPARDATRVCFVLADHPGIFSRLAGALALVGANIVDARTYTSKDGFATAVFWIQDLEGRPYEEAKLPRLKRMIERTFAGEVVARDALAERDKLSKRERAFRVPTKISFDNEGSDIYTIIEIDTRDRPGLLYDLTRTLAANHIQIASAVIATYGVQVVDTFYVKDMFGLKIYSKAKQEALEKKLRAAIAAGAERAGAA